MALQVSTGFKTQILGPTSFADIFAGGEIRVYTGGRPTYADYAEPSAASLLGVIRPVINREGGLHFTQSNAIVAKAGADVWQFTASRDGTAVWWRLVAPNDMGIASPVYPRIDGDVGTSDDPKEMVMATRTYTANDTVVIDSFFYTIPPII